MQIDLSRRKDPTWLQSSHEARKNCKTHSEHSALLSLIPDPSPPGRGELELALRFCGYYDCCLNLWEKSFLDP